MSERVAVKAADAFDEDPRATVEVDGVPVGVLRVEGEYFALRNECAHQGGPVCSGEVTNELIADVPERGQLPNAEFAGEKTISCPWHGYTYELATGEHIGDSTFRLQTFEVVVEEGMVYVEA